MGTRGPRKTKTAMTIICSLGGSTLNSRSGFARKDKISPGNPSGENGVQEVSCESLPTTSALNDWQQFYQLH